jgi:hypothetical protein
MTRRADTLAAGQRQQRPAMSVLPAGHFARAGGAELTGAEQRLIEDFRQMGDSSRAVMVAFFAKQASRDREQRIALNASQLRLVPGGAA